LNLIFHRQTADGRVQRPRQWIRNGGPETGFDGFQAWSASLVDRYSIADTRGLLKVPTLQDIFERVRCGSKVRDYCRRHRVARGPAPATSFAEGFFQQTSLIDVALPEQWDWRSERGTATAKTRHGKGSVVIETSLRILQDPLMFPTRHGDRRLQASGLIRQRDGIAKVLVAKLHHKIVVDTGDFVSQALDVVFVVNDPSERRELKVNRRGERLFFFGAVHATRPEGSSNQFSLVVRSIDFFLEARYECCLVKVGIGKGNRSDRTVTFGLGLGLGDVLQETVQFTCGRSSRRSTCTVGTHY
jgi:hypothetical protein